MFDLALGEPTYLKITFLIICVDSCFGCDFSCLWTFSPMFERRWEIDGANFEFLAVNLVQILLWALFGIELGSFWVQLAGNSQGWRTAYLRQTRNIGTKKWLGILIASNLKSGFCRFQTVMVMRGIIGGPTEAIKSMTYLFDPCAFFLFWKACFGNARCFVFIIGFH